MPLSTTELTESDKELAAIVTRAHNIVRRGIKDMRLPEAFDTVHMKTSPYIDMWEMVFEQLCAEERPRRQY